MKRFIALFSLFLVVAPALFAREDTVLARVTVYWRGEGQMRAAWNGARLREGHVAVDPDKIPYGSKVIFADGSEFKAVDTGPAVVSRQAARSAARNATQRNALVVDRFFETKEQAMAWVDSHGHYMTLRVVKPGSEKKSVPERTMLAQTNTGSTILPQIHLPAIQAPSGLQTFDATALALLPFLPFMRRAFRRRAVALQACYS